MLALLCDSWANYHEARRIVEKEGRTCRGDKGTVFQHPCVGQMNVAWRQILKAAAEFGLTPSSRVELRVAPPVELTAIEKRVFDEKEMYRRH